MTTQPKDPANPTDDELLYMATEHDYDSVRATTKWRRCYTAGRASREPEIEALRTDCNVLAEMQVKTISRADDAEAHAEKAEAELAEVKAELLDYQTRWAAEQREVARLRVNSFAAADIEPAYCAAHAVMRDKYRLAHLDGACIVARDMVDAALSVLKAAFQSPQPAEARKADLEECDGPGCSYPLGCIRCNPDFIPDSIAAKVAPFETAPRLTKGMRYRVVDANDDDFADAFPEYCIDEEFIAVGDEGGIWGFEPYATQGGWYALRPGSGLHRVVRVEPEQPPLARSLSAIEAETSDWPQWRKDAAAREFPVEPAKCLGCVNGVLVNDEYETALCPNPDCHEPPKCERCGGEGLLTARVSRNLVPCGACNGTGEKGEG